MAPANKFNNLFDIFGDNVLKCNGLNTLLRVFLVPLCWLSFSNKHIRYKTFIIKHPAVCEIAVLNIIETLRFLSLSPTMYKVLGG